MPRALLAYGIAPWALLAVVTAASAAVMGDQVARNVVVGVALAALATLVVTAARRLAVKAPRARVACLVTAVATGSVGLACVALAVYRVTAEGLPVFG
ncbi:hypothetical protein [Demequina sp. NBRC 110057]|uniref:hypothetical protein n=1 Tax=Demequina sp. NBRC 110057 TaxID=1570346 RepID=UPI000A006257|nr:hypothetical protein [Demequina sp. NBRC 110057]